MMLALSFIIFIQAICGGALVLNRFTNILNLAGVEERVVQLAKSEIKRYEVELAALKSYVKDYEETTQRHLDGVNPEKSDANRNPRVFGDEGNNPGFVVASNPILIYQLSYRFATKFPRLQKLLLQRNPDGDELKAMLASFAHPNVKNLVEERLVHPDYGVLHQHLPHMYDHEESLESLAFLYDTYGPNFSPANFTSRFSPDTAQPILMNAAHALKISLKAFYHGLYSTALDWIHYSEERVEKYRDDSITIDLVHYTRDFMIKTHNFDLKLGPGNFSVNTYISFFEHDITNAVFKDRTSVITRRESIRNSLEKKKVSDRKLNDSEILVVTYSLCGNSDSFQRDANLNLKCVLDARKHPFYLINPLKIEYLSKEPKVYQIYDALNEHETQTLIYDLARMHLQPDFNRSFFPDENGTRNAPNATHVGIEVTDADWLKPLEKKSEALTGLRASTEQSSFRIMEYVAGRYRGLRRDLDFEETDSSGKVLQGKDKIATIVFYLTIDVEGGKTVFPTLGIVGSPVRGSMIYWENFDDKGMGVDDLWYKECPVSSGHKVVISKSFHYSYQQDKLNCPVK